MTRAEDRDCHVRLTLSWLEELAAIATRLRRHVIKMTYYAGSGHPGGSLSAADMMAALYFQRAAGRPGDDRIGPTAIGSSCRRAMPAPSGTRRWPSAATSRWTTCGGCDRRTATSRAIPTCARRPGVDMTAGPLGSGLAAGAGMAMGAAITGRAYRTYVMLGEGDLQEGATWEALLFAGHHKLSNLCALIDYNRSQVDGKSDDILSLDPAARQAAGLPLGRAGDRRPRSGANPRRAGLGQRA